MGDIQQWWISFNNREANRILIQEAGQIEDLTVSYRTMIWALQAPQ